MDPQPTPDLGVEETACYCGLFSLESWRHTPEVSARSTAITTVRNSKPMSGTGPGTLPLATVSLRYKIQAMGSARALRRTSTIKVINQSFPIMFCFFIDSLDEFDGNYATIVHIIKDLAASPYIQICLSSRPWNVFLNAFPNRH